jgi:uncharacterized protein (UPF0305 family)
MSLLLSTYKQALKLLPPAYRDHYAEPMIQTLEDMLKDQSSSVARAQVWLRTMADLPITASYQYIHEGGATMYHMPTYAKQGTIASSILLLPFFIFVVLNVIHPLTASWNGVGYVGVFVLPTIALILGLGLLGKLLVSKELTLSLKQIQSNWMLFAVPILALCIVGFVLGHDRVHCITAGNPQQIMECIGRG